MNWTIIVIFALIILIFVTYNKHDAYENFSSDEAVQSIASLYNQGSNLTINQLTTTSNINLGGDMNMKAGTKINSTGRLNIGNDEILYLLPKSGVVISKSTGGNGNLNVEGILTAPTLNSTTATISNLITQNSTINGDLVAKQTSTFSGNLVANGRVKFRMLDNTAPPNGWDLGDLNSTSAADCVTQCQNKYPNAISAGYRKSDRHCWCKSLIAHGGTNSDWSTMFFI